MTNIHPERLNYELRLVSFWWDKFVRGRRSRRNIGQLGQHGREDLREAGQLADDIDDVAVDPSAGV